MSQSVPDMTTEWSFPVEVELIDDYKDFHIAPDTEEKEALASRLGLVSLDDLRADLRVENVAGKFCVKGHIEAAVTQSCVVTLEPVKSSLAEDFEAWFVDRDKAISFVRARQEKLARQGQTELPVLEECEDPEPVVNGRIDLGEQVAQFLSLAIDPYPHAQGADYPLQDDDQGAIPDIRKNPFAALKDWKAGPGSADV